MEKLETPDAVAACHAILDKVRKHIVAGGWSNAHLLYCISEYRRFGPVVAEAVDRVGDDVFVEGWTLPLGAAPGVGHLRTITTWRCEGNFLHGLYPIVRVGPDLQIRIGGPEQP